MNKFYAYLYTDPSRNEPIYVGKGCGMRWKFHKSRKDMHPFTHRLQLMKRNGVEPVISFLCENVDSELASLVEEEAISKFGRKDLKRGTLLNLTDGGEGAISRILSDVTKQKLSESAAGRKLSDAEKEQRKQSMLGKPSPNRGKTFSNETKTKMSESKKGMKWPELVCPRCQKSGSSNAMKRWHFDKCRSA